MHKHLKRLKIEGWVSRAEYIDVHMRVTGTKNCCEKGGNVGVHPVSLPNVSTLTRRQSLSCSEWQ